MCGCLAKTGHKACIALLDADVGSMLQAHIKQPDTMLCMFEGAALIVSAVANSAGEVCTKSHVCLPWGQDRS